MRRCERPVAGRVPVLGQDDVPELAHQAVDHGHDLVAIGNGERPARAEIVLNVDDQQEIAVRRLETRHCHSLKKPVPQS